MRIPEKERGRVKKEVLRGSGDGRGDEMKKTPQDATKTTPQVIQFFRARKWSYPLHEVIEERFLGVLPC